MSTGSGGMSTDSDAGGTSGDEGGSADDGGSPESGGMREGGSTRGKDGGSTTGCLIDGKHVLDGQSDPDNDCMRCRPDVDDRAYSPADPGTSCVTEDPMRIVLQCSADGECGTPYCSVRDCWTVMPTGQTQCADESGVTACPSVAGSAACATTPGCGQDAQYPDAAARDYTAATTSGDLLVTDSHTGLTWQGTMTDCGASDPKCSQTYADLHCLNLVYGGFSDWRLPSLYELLALIAPGQLTPATEFPATPSTWDSWSRTIDAADPTQALVITYALAGNATLFDKAGSQVSTARCVRGTLLTHDPAERFFADSPASDETVLDRSTGLIWQKTGIAESPGKTWFEALAYCEGLDYGGEQDWRLPNFHELLSLLDLSRDDPATAFPGASSEALWSSSHASPSIAGAAYPVDFTGAAGGGDLINPFSPSMSSELGVRCVR